jgi:hypothetical protein
MPVERLNRRIDTVWESLVRKRPKNGRFRTVLLSYKISYDGAFISNIEIEEKDAPKRKGES